MSPGDMQIGLGLFSMKVTAASVSCGAHNVSGRNGTLLLVLMGKSPSRIHCSL